MVCESCVRQAGGMTARNIAQFEDLFLLAQRLHSKPVGGNRLALLSSAGFEAVAMADSLQSDDYRMKLADFFTGRQGESGQYFNRQQIVGPCGSQKPL